MLYKTLFPELEMGFYFRFAEVAFQAEETCDSH
jgi:hypothetical protein